MSLQNTPFETEIISFMQRHHFKTLVPRAALIDMDGTLFDSMPMHAAAWQQMMAEHGYETTREEFFMYEGRTAAATSSIILRREKGRDATPEEVEEMYNRKKELFNRMGQAKVMPGAADVIDTFMKVGLKRVLVTGSGQNSLLERLDREFPGGFSRSLMVTGADVVHGKPHPEPYIRGMQLARVKPSESIVLENAPLGVEAGDRAGAFTIGVATGPIPVETLAEAGAAVTFKSMTECAEMMPLLLMSIYQISQSALT